LALIIVVFFGMDLSPIESYCGERFPPSLSLPLSIRQWRNIRW
jgi:hypothetical protein